MSEVVPLDGLLQSRAAPLLCYPVFDADEAGWRLGELRALGVEVLELRGRHRVGAVPVLGKGHVGIVVATRLHGAPAALKIRRVDADRESFEAEAVSLRRANQVSVGPRLLGFSQNFLLMELVEGDYLPNWLGGLGPSEGRRLSRVLRLLLDKVRCLDAAGLDHGELSSAHRHVIVANDRPRIIDFESASASRRVANVTSIAHYIFFNGRMRGMVGGLLPVPEARILIEALRRYKRSPTDGNFLSLLRVCGLSA